MYQNTRKKEKKKGEKILKCFLQKRHSIEQTAAPWWSHRVLAHPVLGGLGDLTQLALEVHVHSEVQVPLQQHNRE